jgi:hypothetical protein
MKYTIVLAATVRGLESNVQRTINHSRTPLEAHSHPFFDREERLWCQVLTGKRRKKKKKSV